MTSGRGRGLSLVATLGFCCGALFARDAFGGTPRRYLSEQLLLEETQTVMRGQYESPQGSCEDFASESAAVDSSTGCTDACWMDEACVDGCTTSCTDACGSRGLLFGLIRSSDHCFDDFISPMTNPVFFEDPRTLTEIRPIFVHHKVPLAAGSGRVNLMAAQIRLALTDRISLIATKDGFMTSTNPLIDDGWTDVAAGLKINLLKDPIRQRILSGGITYEMPVGTPRALQGNGDGEFHVFFTGGSQVGQLGHWISATGFRLPADTTDESQVWYWSNHFDRRLARGLYGLLEFNWYHWLRSGVDGPLLGVEGLDIVNLGAPGVAGNDILTGAFGFKLKPNRHSELGIAWEFPLTERRDIIDNRLTVDWILRY